MVKAGKRSSAGVAAFPIAVIPKKTDHQLQSLLNYGDNLEEFVAICAHLPTELKDDLKKVAELSEETHRLTAELSRDQVEILERAKEKYRQMSHPEQVKNLIDEDDLERAREKRKKVDHGVTEKVSITKRMYGALDTCIKNIDEEIAMLEKDVKDSYGVVPDIPTLLSAEAKKSDEEAAAGPQAVAGQAVYPGATAAYGAGAIGAGAVGAAAGGGARRGELTGTNEPVYCVCRQVGWGDMIGCDNEDCEHGEWFHYHCVGLQQVDEQQQRYWLCPGCTLDQKEREKKEEQEQKATSRNSTPVKLAADAVKLPDEGEEEEEEEEEDNNEEESEAQAGELCKQGKLAAPKEGGESKEVRTAREGDIPNAPANEKGVANTSKADSPSWNAGGRG